MHVARWFTRSLSARYVLFPLYFVQWLAIIFVPMMAFVTPFYGTLVVLVLVGFFILLSKQSPMLLALSLVSLYFGYITLVQQIPQQIGYERCFEFNVSYPGNRRYHNCVASLQVSDYVSEMLRP